MSLKPGGNAPARRENENDGVASTVPTAQNSERWIVKYIIPFLFSNRCKSLQVFLHTVVFKLPAIIHLQLILKFAKKLAKS